MYVILDGHFSLGLRTVAVHGTHLECRINTFPGVPGQQALRQIMQRPGRPGQARGHGRERADLTQMANSARFIVLVPMTSVAREIRCLCSSFRFAATAFSPPGLASSARKMSSRHQLFSGRVVRNWRRINSEGLLPLDVLSHAGTGSDRRTRYEIRGRTCNVGIEHEWGETGLSRR